MAKQNTYQRNGFSVPLIIGIVLIFGLVIVYYFSQTGSINIPGFSPTLTPVATVSPVPTETVPHQTQYETKTTTPDPTTGTMVTTEDAVVSSIDIPNEKYTLILSDNQVINASITTDTVISRVTSYDYDENGYVVGLSIGTADTTDLTAITINSLIRVSYPEEEVVSGTINLQKVVIYTIK